jgi:Ca2+-binding EF-hand superfamily protein
MYDGDGEDGGLTFDEFVEFQQFSQDFAKHPDKFYERMFTAIDRDKDGALSPLEFQEFCRILGQLITEADASAIVKSMDSRGTGKLLFEDLLRWIAKT